MASWQCTNTKFDRTPCGNIVESGVPPVGICNSCKQIGKWVKIAEGRPQLVRQNAQMELDRIRKTLLANIVNGLKEPSMEVGLAGEILTFIRNVSSHKDRGWIGRMQDEKRVKSRLRICWNLFHNADYLVSKLSPQSSPVLIDELNTELQRKWDVAGGLLGGKPDFERYALAPQQLRGYGQYVITRTEIIWRGLKAAEDKEKFIYHVFEHDKGYNRIVEAIDGWELGVRPKEEDVPDLQRLQQEKGVGGLEKGVGKKVVIQISTILGLEGDVRAGLDGKWKGKVFYKKEVGSYEMTDFDPKTREYTYKYLGPDDKRKT